MKEGDEMKRLFWVLAVLFAFAATFCVWGSFDRPGLAEDGDKAPEAKSICPATRIAKDCMDCHAVVKENGKARFALKEVDPHAGYEYPNSGFKFMEDDKGRLGYFVCMDIDANTFANVFAYLDRHGVRRLTIELQTPGGSIMQMWRIVSQMDEWKKAGGEITCLVKGFCASAGFVLLNNASPGKRYVAANAEIMWHEVQSLKIVFGFDVTTPSDKEDEARILRHFQNNGNTFLSQKSGMTKEEIDEKVRKREWWMTGQEAISFGFADKML